MAIKVTLESGTIVEGTADELAEYLRLAKEVMEEKGGPTSEKIYDKPARVGDIIRITNAHILNKGRDYDNGDVMKVERVESCRSVYETNKYDGIIADYEFEIIGRVNEKLRTVKRKAKVGERILITNSGTEHTAGSYKDGDILTVRSRYSPRGVTAEELRSGPFVYDREYEVIVEVDTEPSPKPTPEITIGKRYELTADGECGDIKKGKRVIVTYKCRDGTYKVNRIDARNRDFDFVNPEDLAEIKPGEGDIVRVTGTTNGHDVGTIGVVTGVRYDGVMSVRAMYNGSMSTFTEHSTELVALKEERSDV